VIGRRARIQNRVTFYALEHTSVEVGDNARIENGNASMVRSASAKTLSPMLTQSSFR
jgi:hypothetical protein